MSMLDGARMCLCRCWYWCSTDHSLLDTVSPNAGTVAPCEPWCRSDPLPNSILDSVNRCRHRTVAHARHLLRTYWNASSVRPCITPTYPSRVVVHAPDVATQLDTSSEVGQNKKENMNQKDQRRSGSITVPTSCNASNGEQPQSGVTKSSSHRRNESNGRATAMRRYQIRSSTTASSNRC